VQTGFATSGRGGSISLVVGSGNSGTGGNIFLSAGPTTAATTYGGDVILAPGSGTSGLGYIYLSGPIRALYDTSKSGGACTGAWTITLTYVNIMFSGTGCTPTLPTGLVDGQEITLMHTHNTGSEAAITVSLTNGYWSGGTHAAISEGYSLGLVWATVSSTSYWIPTYISSGVTLS